MPQGMKPRSRRVKMATKPIRKAFKKITEGMMIPPKTLQTGPRRIKTDGPMQARPLPMTPELIKKAKDKMVPNPRAQQRERDRSKPIIGIPMRRSSARRK